MRNWSKSKLFPISLQISKDKKEVFVDLIPSLNKLGFEIQEFGGDTFVVHGIPAGFQDNNLQDVIDGLIEQFIENKNLRHFKKRKLGKVNGAKRSHEIWQVSDRGGDDAVDR